MNTPEPCCNCFHLYYDCMRDDDPGYMAECKLGLKLGDPKCKRFVTWDHVDDCSKETTVPVEQWAEEKGLKRPEDMPKKPGRPYLWDDIANCAKYVAPEDMPRMVMIFLRQALQILQEENDKE